MMAVALVFVALALPGGALRGADGDLEPFYHALVAMIFRDVRAVRHRVRRDDGQVQERQGRGSDPAGLGQGTGLHDRPVVCVAYFLELLSSSNLTTILSVKGADALREFALPPPLLGVSLILVAAGLDLLAPAATAKWAMIAPAVVPMYMLLGLEPAAATAAYRIGDSAVNIINPCSVYMAFTLVVIRRFLPEFSLSSLLTQMAPYAISILLAGIDADHELHSVRHSHGIWIMNGAVVLNPVAIVSGGSTGIGLATVRALRAAGMKVGFFSSSAPKVEAALASLAAEHGPDVHAAVVDVSDDGAVGAFHAEVEAKLGAVERVGLQRGHFAETRRQAHSFA